MMLMMLAVRAGLARFLGGRALLHVNLCTVSAPLWQTGRRESFVVTRSATQSKTLLASRVQTIWTPLDSRT